MKIDVVRDPSSAYQPRLEDSIAVVIDVLRAASTICTALANGCREIIPVAEVADAYDAAAIYPRPLLLFAGERHGRRIDGFDLGNSPKEFQPEVVAGKIIILTTTNGTRALLWAQGAQRTLVLSFLNLHSVISFLSTVDQDVVIICSGQDGEESLEDTVCAGLLVERLQEILKDKLQLTEQARGAAAVDRDHKIDLLAMMIASPHGEHLQKIGYADDLEICSRLNSLDVLPVYTDGAIRLLPR